MLIGTALMIAGLSLMAYAFTIAGNDSTQDMLAMRKVRVMRKALRKANGNFVPPMS